MILCSRWRIKLPGNVSGERAVRALRRLGFVEVRQTGSHRILRKEARTVVVPRHRPIKPRTLKGLSEQAGLTLEDFVAKL